MSILDIRSYQDTDNQIIKDNIDSINTSSHIMIAISVFILLTGIMFMIRSKRQDFLNIFFSLSARTGSFIMIAIGILILIVGIIQRVKINNILPDMSDENAVKSYNDHHTIPASSVLGSNMGIILFGIIFLFAGIVQFFMNRKEEPQLIKSKGRIQYEQGKSYANEKKQEWENAVASGKYDISQLNEMQAIYENADAAVEKAWAEYTKGIDAALAQSHNVKQTIELGKVKTSLSTPVSSQAGAVVKPPFIQNPNTWGQH